MRNLNRHFRVLNTRISCDRLDLARPGRIRLLLSDVHPAKTALSQGSSDEIRGGLQDMHRTVFENQRRTALLNVEPYRYNSCISFRIVIVIQNRRRAHRVYAKARAENKLELASSRARPEVKHNPVWLYFVAVDAVLFGPFQRFAINFHARRQSDFRYHHAVTSESDPLSFHSTS